VDSFNKQSGAQQAINYLDLKPEIARTLTTPSEGLHCQIQIAVQPDS